MGVGGWEWRRCEGEGDLMCSYAIKSEEAMQAEYAAEDPNPAPMGRLDDAVNVNSRL